MNCLYIIIPKFTDLFIFKFVVEEGKCKASRGANDLPYRMGRGTHSVWNDKFISINL